MACTTQYHYFSTLVLKTCVFTSVVFLSKLAEGTEKECDDIIIQYSNVTDCVFSIPENTSANISFHLKDTKCTNEVICMIEISRFNNNSKTFETQCTFVLKDNNCFSKELYCSCFSFHGPYLFTKTMERADNTKWKISVIGSNKIDAFIKINVTHKVNETSTISAGNTKDNYYHYTREQQADKKYDETSRISVGVTVASFFVIVFFITLCIFVKKRMNTGTTDRLEADSLVVHDYEEVVDVECSDSQITNTEVKETKRDKSVFPIMILEGATRGMYSFATNFDTTTAYGSD